MALNLGDVNFKLGADYNNLKNAVQRLKDFGTAVDAAEAKTGKAARRTETAFRKQEKAVTDSLRTILNLNSKMRGFDFSTNLIRNNNKAWRELNTTLTRGVSSATEMQRAQTQFRNAIAANTRQFNKLKSEAKNTREPVSKMSEAMRNLASTSVLVNGPLGGVATRLTTLASLTNNAGLGFAAMAAGTALATATIISFGGAVVTAGQKLKEYQAIFQSLAQDDFAGSLQLQESKQIARDIGQSYDAVIPTLASFVAAAKGTNLEGTESLSIYKDVGLVMTKLQKPVEQVQGVFKALEQIMSKGTVQSEELRGQLGDRLPGAFGIAARAMGVTTSELSDMLKRGEVLSDDFLPKFRDELLKTFGLQGVTKIDNFRASANNMTNAFTDFKARLDEVTGASTKVKAGMDAITRALRYLQANAETLVAIFGALGGAALGLVAPAIFAGLVRFVTLIRSLTTATAALNAVMLLNPAGALATLLTRVGLAAAGSVAGFKLMQGAIETNKTVMSTGAENVQAFIDRQQDLEVSMRDTTQTYIREVQAQLKILKVQAQALRDAIPKPELKAYDPSIFDKLKNSWRRTFRGTNLADIWDPDESKFQKTRDQLDTVTGKIKTAEDQLVSLKEILANAPDPSGIGGSGSGSGSDEEKVNKGRKVSYDRAANAVRDLFENIQSLKRINAQSDNGLDSILRAEDLEKARELLRGLNQGELKQLQNYLGSIQVQGSNTVQQLTNLYTSQRMMTEQLSKARAEAEKLASPEYIQRQTEALNEFDNYIQLIDQKIEALSKGPKAYDDLQEALDLNNDIKRFADQLTAAGISSEVTAQKVIQLRDALIQLKNTQEQANQTNEAIKQLSDAGDAAIDKFISSTVSNLKNGELSLKSFADIARSVLSDVTDVFVQLAVTNPLKNLAMQGFSGSGGGNGSSILPTLGNALGSVFGGDGFSFGSASSGASSAAIPHFANGGILSRPTMMMSSMGPVIGGEAGQEAILPLSRDSSGNLGIKAGGSGINIGSINIQTQDVNSFKNSESQIAAQIQRMVSKGSRNT